MPVLARYFVVTFAWTWTCWWTAALVETAPAGLLIALGGVGPAAGTVVALRRADPAYRRDFVRRIWDPRRISGPWWLALAAVAVLPALAGYVVAAAAGRPPAAESTVTFGMVAFAVGFALAAGVVEEPGWRGAALDLLQSRMPAATAATLIGIPWAVWHLPLVFVEGTYQHGLGFGSARFWLFNVLLVLLSVLYVWLCNGTHGSILIAILAHAGTNVAGSLIPKDTFSDAVMAVVTFFAVVAIVWPNRGELGSPARPTARPRVNL